MAQGGEFDVVEQFFPEDANVVFLTDNNQRTVRVLANVKVNCPLIVIIIAADFIALHSDSEQFAASLTKSFVAEARRLNFGVLVMNPFISPNYHDRNFHIQIVAEHYIQSQPVPFVGVICMGNCVELGLYLLLNHVVVASSSNSSCCLLRSLICIDSTRISRFVTSDLSNQSNLPILRFVTSNEVENCKPYSGNTFLTEFSIGTDKKTKSSDLPLVSHQSLRTQRTTTPTARPVRKLPVLLSEIFCKEDCVRMASCYTVDPRPIDLFHRLSSSCSPSSSSDDICDEMVSYLRSMSDASSGDIDRPRSTTRHVTWMANDEASSCSLCGRGFSLTRRRHHCRCCGKIFCGSCAGREVKAKHLPSWSFVQAAANGKSVQESDDDDSLVEVNQESLVRVCDNCASPSIETMESPSSTGSTIKISGRNFGSDKNSIRVLLVKDLSPESKSNDASAEVNCPVEITEPERLIDVVVPAGTGNRHTLIIRVAATGISRLRMPVLAGRFHLSYASPCISSTTSPSTLGGSIDISGDNFGCNITKTSVKLRNSQLKVVSVDHSRIVCLVPEGSGKELDIWVHVDGVVGFGTLSYQAPQLNGASWEMNQDKIGISIQGRYLGPSTLGMVVRLCGIEVFGDRLSMTTAHSVIWVELPNISKSVTQIPIVVSVSDSDSNEISIAPQRQRTSSGRLTEAETTQHENQVKAPGWKANPLIRVYDMVMEGPLQKVKRTLVDLLGNYRTRYFRLHGSVLHYTSTQGKDKLMVWLCHNCRVAACDGTVSRPYGFFVEFPLDLDDNDDDNALNELDMLNREAKRTFTSENLVRSTVQHDPDVWEESSQVSVDEDLEDSAKEVRRHWRRIVLADDDETRRDRWVEAIQGQISMAQGDSSAWQSPETLVINQHASFNRDDKNHIVSPPAKNKTFFHIRSRRKYLLDLSMEAESKQAHSPAETMASNDKTLFSAVIIPPTDISPQKNVVRDQNGRAVWTQDNRVAKCGSCGSPFLGISRKHHCRQCGDVVCGSCSRQEMSVHGYNEPQRVCRCCRKACIAAVEELQDLLERKRSLNMQIRVGVHKSGKLQRSIASIGCQEPEIVQRVLLTDLGVQDNKETDCSNIMENNLIELKRNWTANDLRLKKLKSESDTILSEIMSIVESFKESQSFFRGIGDLETEGLNSSSMGISYKLAFQRYADLFRAMALIPEYNVERELARASGDISTVNSSGRSVRQGRNQQTRPTKPCEETWRVESRSGKSKAYVKTFVLDLEPAYEALRGCQDGSTQIDSESEVLADKMFKTMFRLTREAKILSSLASCRIMPYTLLGLIGIRVIPPIEDLLGDIDILWQMEDISTTNRQACQELLSFPKSIKVELVYSFPELSSHMQRLSAEPQMQSLAAGEGFMLLSEYMSRNRDFLPQHIMYLLVSCLHSLHAVGIAHTDLNADCVFVSPSGDQIAVFNLGCAVTLPCICLPLVASFSDSFQLFSKAATRMSDPGDVAPEILGSSAQGYSTRDDDDEGNTSAIVSMLHQGLRVAIDQKYRRGPTNPSDQLESLSLRDRADMWSLGVILYKSLFGSDKQVLTLGGPRANLPALDSFRDSSERDLLLQLLIVAPEKRLSAEDTLRHPFFTVSPVKKLLDSKQIFSDDDKFLLFRAQIEKIDRNYDNVNHLRLHRSKLVPSVVRALRGWGRMNILSEIQVQYEGEAGVDAGGLSKDLFRIFFEEVVKSAHGLFECAESRGSSRQVTFLPSSSCKDLGALECVGRLVLKALIDGYLIAPVLSVTLFKYLLDPSHVPAFDDLEGYDLELSHSLRANVLDINLSAEYVEMTGLTFEGLPGRLGRFNAVTDENKMQYVLEKALHVLISSRQPQLEAFRRGFLTIDLSDSALKRLNHQDLMRILQGPDTICANDLLAIMQFDAGWPSKSKTPDMLRQWVSSQSSTNLKKFVRFVTGSPNLPYSPTCQQAVPIIVSRMNEGTSNRLPQTHTCTNGIELPEYDNIERLGEKLLVAMEGAGDFFHNV